jgi:hypothetical protein
MATNRKQEIVVETRLIDHKKSHLKYARVTEHAGVPDLEHGQGNIIRGKRAHNRLPAGALTIQ